MLFDQLVDPRRRFCLGQSADPALKTATAAARGTNSVIRSSFLAVSSIESWVNLVRLPPGEANLRPRRPATGSSPVTKTIGIVEVAFFAASSPSSCESANRRFLRGGNLVAALFDD